MCYKSNRYILVKGTCHKFDYGQGKKAGRNPCLTFQVNVAKYFSSLDPSSIRWNDSSKRFENTFTFSIWREVATVTVCYVHQIGIPLFDLSAIFATKERQLK